MFLCETCHDDAKCPWLMELRSYGRCEDCGKTQVCYDCHGYGR